MPTKKSHGLAQHFTAKRRGRGPKAVTFVTLKNFAPAYLRDAPRSAMRQAIVTEYLEPTDYRGACVKATAYAGSIVLSWDGALDVDDNHGAAARALATKYGWLADGSELRGGSFPDNAFAFVLVQTDAAQPKARKLYATIADIKRANRALDNGVYWFAPGAMRFFGTRILPTVYGGRCFITSEQMRYDTPRKYSVRECLPDGSIDTIGDSIMLHATREDAIAAAKAYLAASAKVRT